MKVALVYDRVNKWGGAERVLLALHKMFPEALLYTSVYNPQTAPWAKAFDIRTSFLQKLPYASSAHELYAALMPIAFESFSFDEYDLVISVTSEAAKGIITKPKTKHICYCLTPTRYLWSTYDHYFRNLLLRFLSKPVVSYLRTWDKIASQRPDAYIAISREVQGRIKKYYGRDSVVVYPPVEISNLKSQKSNSQNLPRRHSGEPRLDRGDSRIPSVDASSDATKRFWTSQNDDREQNSQYFLTVSRLVPYKKIDIAVKTFNKLKLPLKIVGTGSQEKYLKSISGSTIEFLGSLTEDELVGYYKGCRALIFPGIEDFGLTILEAQSFGKPVIAFRGGGALETIKEGKTGEFFRELNPKSLIDVVERFDEGKYKSSNCIGNAKKFSYERFKKEFMNAVRDC